MHLCESKCNRLAQHFGYARRLQLPYRYIFHSLHVPVRIISNITIAEFLSINAKDINI